MPESPQTGTERLVINQQPVTLSYYGLDQEGIEYAVLSVSGLENEKADFAHMLMLNLYSKFLPTSLLGKSDNGEVSVKATFQRNILLDGYPGREYRIQARNRIGVWRFYYVGKKFYVIAASTGRNENVLMSRFLDSFALGSAASAVNTKPLQPEMNLDGQQAAASASSSRGTWLIILKTFARAERSKANKQLSLVRSLGYDAHLVDTDHYPNLKKGLLAVAIGPQSKDAAEDVLSKVRSVAPGSYLKSGW